VCELIGGVTPAKEFVLRAFANGKHVVSANKELIAKEGHDIMEEAARKRLDFQFEGSVAGGIPIIQPMKNALGGNKVQEVMGIVNGTTNYILTKMSEEGAAYADALAEAQSLGYAERDPTADVEGYDAGAKAAILASIAFGSTVVAGDVYHEGISGVTVDDIAFAHRLGYEVKLLAIAEQSDDGRIAVRVHPAMLPKEHPLASVRESFNAVFVEGESVGQLMFYGRGAGGGPSGSAVLGDLIDAAVNLRRGAHATVGALARASIRPIDEVHSEYYLNLEVVDRPGVLHAVSGVFAEHGVSIRSMEQEPLVDSPDGARLVFITHDAAESAVQSTLHDLRKLDVVRTVTSVLRVIGE